MVVTGDRNEQTTLTERAERALQGCTRVLTGHGLRSPREILLELAETTDPDLTADRYGMGELINGFEAQIAELLGKEAAVFLPSGTLAQQIALRVWSERRGSLNIAMHPRNHLDLHEAYAYQRLHGLRGIAVGQLDRLLTLDDLRKVAEPLAALLIELPQREIGGQLPSWDDLVAVTDWAHARGAATHLDGARLWESGPFYGRPYHEITALFDTVYVSFYKGLGGLTGSALAGPADVIAEARVWQHRQGGRLFQLFPYVLSARRGLEQRLGRMADYHQRAVEIASDLAAFPQIAIVPNPPQTNMMHLYLRGDHDRLLSAAIEVAEETGIGVLRALAPTPLPEYQKWEFTVGDATLALSREEIAATFAALLERAGS
ncbi:MAG TPA: beta-eliminating lyase-related protein [Nitrolancea sp.]|nr:beta-eliminating lyase-related protein [Nitrolancea sp.]